MTVSWKLQELPTWNLNMSRKILLKDWFSSCCFICVQRYCARNMLYVISVSSGSWTGCHYKIILKMPLYTLFRQRQSRMWILKIQSGNVNESISLKPESIIWPVGRLEMHMNRPVDWKCWDTCVEQSIWAINI